MAFVLSAYLPPTSIQSYLFNKPPEAVPPTDDLVALHAELETLKQQTLVRGKKAENDLRTIEETMKRMKEKEKGKAKAVDKVKKERIPTPLPDADEYRAPVLSKVRLTTVPSIGVASSSRSSLDPRQSTADEAKKKKKKRKRDDDSDGEHDSQRARRASPALSQTTHLLPLVHKPTAKPNISSLHVPSKSSGGQDFSIPTHRDIVTPRPPIPPPPIPGPSKPSEVTEDFSKAKQPPQTLVSTFYTSIEPWIRGIKEEDVGFLEFTADEVAPYIMPKPGPHYTAVWEQEDRLAFGMVPPDIASSSTDPSSTLPKWDPSTLSDADLVTDDKGHGPLTERLITALLDSQDTFKSVKAAEEAMEGRGPGSGGREKYTVADLEERVRNTMRFHGFIDADLDYSESVDDPISTALRHAQQELRTVVATNKARKARLAEIAKDRLGYQEYIEVRDSIDRNICALYAKFQKRDKPRPEKKKKKDPGGPNGVVNGTGTNGGAVNGNGTAAVGEGVAVTAMPCAAALGLGLDDENRLEVPEQLRTLVQARRRWVDSVGGTFEEIQRESPGRIWGLPKRSVFEGVDEEVREALGRGGGGLLKGNRGSKGKGKERADAMELG